MECYECAIPLHEELKECPECHEVLCLDCAPVHESNHDDQTRSDIEHNAFSDERG